MSYYMLTSHRAPRTTAGGAASAGARPAQAPSILSEENDESNTDGTCNSGHFSVGVYPPARPHQPEWSAGTVCLSLSCGRHRHCRRHPFLGPRFPAGCTHYNLFTGADLQISNDNILLNAFSDAGAMLLTRHSAFPARTLNRHAQLQRASAAIGIVYTRRTCLDAFRSGGTPRVSLVDHQVAWAMMRCVEGTGWLWPAPWRHAMQRPRQVNLRNRM